jgi:hypothetical protein
MRKLFQFEILEETILLHITLQHRQNFEVQLRKLSTGARDNYRLTKPTIDIHQDSLF